MTVDTLQSYTRGGSGGPTATTTAQDRFAQRLRGVLGRINAAIKRGIIQDDIFNLQEESDTLAVDDPGPFETDDSARATVLFIGWLREQLNNEYLEVVGPDSNQWLRKAYAQGIRNVHGQLKDADIAFQRPDMDELLGAPIHTRKLQTLYTRTYSNLESVADDIVSDVRDTLTEGFRDGLGPREIARNLTDRVDSIGKHRSTMIARSEVINAHSEGSLTRIDEINDEVEEQVAVTHGVWDAANDDRVCAFCRALDGTTMSTTEMRDNTVEVISEIGENFLGNTFRLQPPAHPNGRCNIRVMVGTGDLEESLDERLPEELTTNGG